MHPFVKILLFIFILVLMNFLGRQAIGLLCIFVSLFALRLHSANFLPAVKRMRWLFISIFMIYAFATPGEYIAGFPLTFAPSYEGLALGLLQITRLLIALASISILFATSSKEELIAGLYILLWPLHYIGFNVQQFAVRLLLTLDYVDELAHKNALKLNFYDLDDLNIAENELTINKIIALHQPPFRRLDYAMITTIMLCLLVLSMPDHLISIKLML